MSIDAPTAETLPANPSPGPGRRWAWMVAVLAMAVTLLPYLWGVYLTGARPALGWFSGYTFNATDHCVYLSWMRQAADGHFFQRNLFTTEPQGGHQFNLFFLALGWLSALTHLSPTVIYQVARMVLGVVLLRAIWWLLEMWLSDERARKAAFLCVCFSAGLGWAPGLWELGILRGPVDTWQPEAITFLSLYLFPLFVVSLLLMVGVIGWMWKAEEQRSARYAVYAGLCGLLLGNIHTYDVITLCAVWGGYLVVRTIQLRRFDAGMWGRALIACALTAISTGYMAYLLKTESVFLKRALVKTVSPPLSLYLLGFGLVAVLALVGALSQPARSAFTQPDRSDSRLSTLDSRLFLLVWSVMNVAVAYLPVAFQRKMIMGVHIPVAVLAGVGLFALLRRLERRQWVPALAGAVLLISLTNARTLVHDTSKLGEGRWGKEGPPEHVRTYLYSGEFAALEWLRTHSPAGTVVQPLPWVMASGTKRGFFDNSVACYAPGLTGHAVNAGHWGETPDFGETMNQWARFVYADTDDNYRTDLLRKTGVKYVVFSQKHDETVDPETEGALLSTFRNNPPTYLRLIPEASNPDAEVYEVVGRE